MKLWEIKANALKLMFADSDVVFSYDEFSDGSLAANSNTREKLIRMNDSISRAIDQYYSICGEPRKYGNFYLDSETEDDMTTYYNRITISEETVFGSPLRIDVYFYSDISDTTTLIDVNRQVDFSYDRITKTIFFLDDDYAQFDGNTKFVIWYKMPKLNLPSSPDDLTYDLNVLYIPEEIQRMIPYYVKGELYEEDEPDLAQIARKQYLQFVAGLGRESVNVQRKVRHAAVFDK